MAEERYKSAGKQRKDRKKEQSQKYKKRPQKKLRLERGTQMKERIIEG